MFNLYIFFLDMIWMNLRHVAANTLVQKPLKWGRYILKEPMTTSACIFIALNVISYWTAASIVRSVGELARNRATFAVQHSWAVFTEYCTRFYSTFIIFEPSLKAVAAVEANGIPNQFLRPFSCPTSTGIYSQFHFKIESISIRN